LTVSLPTFADEIVVLDPEFFESGQGELKGAAPGKFACAVAKGETPRGESRSIGKIVQDFCGGNPTIQWIPASKSWDPWKNKWGRRELKTKGYYQICCIRRGEQNPSGRYRVRP